MDCNRYCFWWQWNLFYMDLAAGGQITDTAINLELELTITVLDQYGVT